MANPERGGSGRADASERAHSAQQKQNSRQSIGNASGDRQRGDGSDRGRTRQGSQGDQQKQSGIGAGQRQDRDSPDLEKQPNSSGDVERGSEGNSRDSLVNDPSGAFKERP